MGVIRPIVVPCIKRISSSLAEALRLFGLGLQADSGKRDSLPWPWARRNVEQRTRQPTSPRRSRKKASKTRLSGLLCIAKTSYKKECQEKYFPVGSGPTLFWSRHSAQPFERVLAIGEWSSSGDVVSWFVSSHETVRFLFLPVVPFPCRDGAHSFLETDKHNDCRIANHGPI